MKKSPPDSHGSVSLTSARSGTSCPGRKACAGSLRIVVRRRSRSILLASRRATDESEARTTVGRCSDRFAAMRTSLVVAISLLLACSKSSSDQKAGSAAPAGSNGSSAGSAGSGSDAAAPSEPAAVVGPTRSAKGALEVTGVMSGKFEWIKKDQTKPISCAWNAEKEIGGLGVDLSDGAGHLLKMTIDVPPTEIGVPRLDVTSKDLPRPVKSSLGFNMTGDNAGQIEVTFDTTLTDADADKTPAK